jgi:predicted kinase
LPGKPLFTQKLVERFGFEVASVDEMMSKRKWDAPDMIQDDWNLVYSQAYQKLEKLLKNGKSVVFDGGSLLKSERNTLKSIAHKRGVSWCLIYINTLREEIIARRKHVLSTNERDPLIDETMDKACGMFEEPQAKEEPITYNSTMNFEDWVKKNLDL